MLQCNFLLLFFYFFLVNSIGFRCNQMNSCFLFSLDLQSYSESCAYTESMGISQYYWYCLANIFIVSIPFALFVIQKMSIMTTRQTDIKYFHYYIWFLVGCFPKWCEEMKFINKQNIIAWRLAPIVIRYYEHIKFIQTYVSQYIMCPRHRRMIHGRHKHIICAIFTSLLFASLMSHNAYV